MPTCVQFVWVDWLWVKSFSNYSAFDLFYVTVVTKHHISKSLHTVVYAKISFLLCMTIIDNVVPYNLFFKWQRCVVFYFTMYDIFALCVHKHLSIHFQFVSHTSKCGIALAHNIWLLSIPIPHLFSLSQLLFFSIFCYSYLTGSERYFILLSFFFGKRNIFWLLY